MKDCLEKCRLLFYNLNNCETSLFEGQIKKIKMKTKQNQLIRKEIKNVGKEKRKKSNLYSKTKFYQSFLLYSNLMYKEREKKRHKEGWSYK